MQPLKPASLAAGRPWLAAAALRPRIGRLARQIRRSLIVAGKPLTTPQIARRVYRTTQYWHVANVYRAAPRVAERVGYRASRGKPVLWRLKTPMQKTPSRTAEKS
jgi:hypothetical protein